MSPADQALSQSDWNQPSAPVAPTQDLSRNALVDILLGLLPAPAAQEVNLGGYSTHPKGMVLDQPSLPTRNPARYGPISDEDMRNLFMGNHLMEMEEQQTPYGSNVIEPGMAPLMPKRT